MAPAMRILAVADIHGGLAQLDRVLAAEGRGADVIVAAGDLVRFLDADGLSQVLERLAATRLPVLAVAGNCDGPQVDALLSRVGYNLRAQGRLMGAGGGAGCGIGFCGLGGAPPWVGNTWFIQEDEAAGMIAQGYAAIAEAQVKILIAHAPPVDVRVETAFGSTLRLPGSTAVREAAERLALDAIICGHIHEGQGIGHIGSCLVVCCGSVRDGRYARLEVETGAAEGTGNANGSHAASGAGAVDGTHTAGGTGAAEGTGNANGSHAAGGRAGTTAVAPAVRASVHRLPPG